jgi:eukaryotic-like serine/threonine-protein kinase
MKYNKTLVGTLLISALSVIPAISPAITLPQEQEPIGSFSFLHFSDIHIGPHLSMPEMSDSLRSYPCVTSAAKLGPTMLEPYDVEAPAPSFVMVSGDVTEYGFPLPTLEVVDKYFADYTIPQYFAPGNHDNTWVVDSNMFRDRFGGMNYTFKHEGITFICLNSATLQEPVQSFGREVVEYLKDTLSALDPSDPIVVMFHHPTSPTKMGSTYGRDIIFDQLKDHNVVMTLLGHHHSTVVDDDSGIPGVHGGSPFGKRNIPGYSIITFTPEEVMVVHNFCDGEEPQKGMLKKEIKRTPPTNSLHFISPKPETTFSDNSPLRIIAKLTGDKNGSWTGEATTDDKNPQPMSAIQGTVMGLIHTEDLINGAHFIQVNLNKESGESTSRSTAFFLDRPERSNEGVAKWRYFLGGCSKANPLVVNNTVYIGSNNGEFVAISADKGEKIWSFDAGAEILTTALWVEDGEASKVVFGAGDGTLYALNTKGEVSWKYKTDQAIFSSPVLGENNTIYFGTNNADIIAVNGSTGEELWKNTDADFSIETSPLLIEGLVVCGAWDGNVYAVSQTDGTLKWKTAGPMCQTKNSRYYGPADDAPKAIGNQIYITDRGYVAGIYDLEGNYVKELATKCAAIASVTDEKALYLRSTANQLIKTDAQGTPSWTVEVPAGRIPSPPTVDGNNVYLTSNTGRLSALSAETGALSWQYQLTPGLYVFSSPTVAGDTIYTTDSFGYLTAITGPKK